MKKVLLTGASGFIGRHTILPLINKGYEVHCTYRVNKPDIFPHDNRVTWHRVDLLDRNAVKKLIRSVSPSHLLHLAWDVTPAIYLESVQNFKWLVSSLDLLNEFGASGERAVGAGTCIEYDVRYGYCNENLTPTIPTTYYGSCKYHLGSIAEKYAKMNDFDFAWGRIFHPYGPYEHSTRLVPSVILSLMKGEPARCTHGNQVRDFLYVADVADAFVTLLDSKVNGVVNIGSGRPVSVKELVMQIASLLGKEENIQLGALPDRENEPQFIVADINRLQKEVRWYQNYSLGEGIQNTISWWESHLNFDNF